MVTDILFYKWKNEMISSSMPDLLVVCLFMIGLALENMFTYWTLPHLWGILKLKQTKKNNIT